MHVQALILELLAQIGETGELRQGDTEIDLFAIDPDIQTGVVTIHFHVDVHTGDGSERRPHVDGLSVLIVEDKVQFDKISPEQFPPGWHPKGVG